MAKKNDSTSKKINSKIEAHDKQHTRNAVKRQKKVEKMFDDATKKASIIASTTSGTKDSFELSKEPAARKRIDEVILQLNEDLSATIINGDKEEWLLSANKNDAIVDYLAQQTNLPTETISQWKSRNLDALEAFQTRKIEGMNLSAKVWNITDQFKGELEMAIDVALGDGVSAAAMSRTVRKLLNNPTALFRRVRDKNGQLRLSQTAKNYHPGRGVYRSAYRNALRLTATETNMAYRTADHTRWQQLNFVTGIEIKLSANHNCRGIAKGQFYDICDELAGVYPKDFKFVGWHPFCRCFAIPKLADMNEFLKYQDKLVAGEDVSGYKFSGEVTQMPKQFNEWIDNNKERIATAKSLPYFIRDNYIGGDISKGLVSQLTANKMAVDAGRLDGFVKFTEKTKNEIASEIRTIGNKLGIFPKNVAVEFSDNLEENTLMEWNGGTVRISCGKYKMDNDKIFCPADDLRNALNKLKGITKGELTFNEEYAIEALFHESIHSKIKIPATNYLQASILEVSTQLYARNNYAKILRAYGKEPVWFDKIKTKGYGYKDGCNLLREYFTKDGELQVGDLINIINGTEDGTKKLLKKFKEFNVPKAKQKEIFESLNLIIKRK